MLPPILQDARSSNNSGGTNNSGGAKQAIALDSIQGCRAVLAVDDNPMQKANLSNWLRTFGLTDILICRDGQHALSFTNELNEPGCLLILDLEMQGMDGIELLQRLYEQEIAPAVIILSSADDVLLSAVATMVEAMNFNLLGALQKPLTPVDIYIALDKFRAPSCDISEQPAESQPKKLIDPLREDLDRGSIQLTFQPRLDIQAGSFAGVEVIARWHTDKGEVLSAEHDGLRERLTLLQLKQTLIYMAKWRIAGHPMPVALQLSAKALGDRLLTNHIMGLVERYNEDPRLITFEISDSALMLDLPHALASISRLRLKGFGFSIDDYGTEFSSMQQLARFPFTELKVSRNLIRGALSDPSLTPLLEAAVNTGRRLGITTIADGVATVEQLRVLRQMGCRQVQGDAIAEPMPANALQDWLQQSLTSALSLCRP